MSHVFSTFLLFLFFCHVFAFLATVCKTVRPMLSDRPFVCASCNVSALWPNGWMYHDATRYGVGLDPGDIVLDGDPVPPWKGAQQPSFRPMPIVAKRSPILATAELRLILSDRFYIR